MSNWFTNLIAETVGSIADVVELSGDILADAVTALPDACDDQELFLRTRNKLEDMKQ